MQVIENRNLDAEIRQKKNDYLRIADIYDRARLLSENTLAQWLGLISEKIDPDRKIEFLDRGCGTGRFAIPIATTRGYSVTGADSSKEMLSKAKEKAGETQIRWDLQNATSLSYSDGSFDAVFMSHLLHHVNEPISVVKECYRTLRSGGTILNRYGAIEHIRDDPEHRFFPEAVECDEARTPTREQVEKWFRAVGSKEISSETIIQQSYRSTEERLKKAKLQSTSVLTLISQPAFRQGLEALQAYSSRYPNDLWLLIDKVTLTTGTKGA